MSAAVHKDRIIEENELGVIEEFNPGKSWNVYEKKKSGRFKFYRSSNTLERAKRHLNTLSDPHISND